MKVYLELKFDEIVFFYVQLCCVNKIILIQVCRSISFLFAYYLFSNDHTTGKKNTRINQWKGLHSPLHGMILIVWNPHHIPLYAAASW